jgi:Fic-DOC domain mobile mystery protein B
MKIINPPGATPLEPDEIEGLIPRHLRTQGDLNAAEAFNIVDANRWLSHQKLTANDILSISCLCKLHQKMFSKTWKWAGKFRQSNKNIGCDKAYITEELKKLLDDTLCQIEFKSYSHREIAARFHHRLVKIHPFANGNGRHARSATDILMNTLQEIPFVWGGDYRTKNEIRNEYILALQAADKNNYVPLFDFLNIIY